MTIDDRKLSNDMYQKNKEFHGTGIDTDDIDRLKNKNENDKKEHTSDPRKGQNIKPYENDTAKEREKK